MHQEINKQKDLMQQALKILEQIETINSFIKPFDPLIAKMMVQELQDTYIDITGKLFKIFLKLSHSL